MNNRQVIWENCMKSKPTQSDVAKLAGVSRATVSYVLNNRQVENAIPIETSERVWSAIGELGYVPNQQAQHLKRQATNRICVILPRLGIPANDLMLQAQRKYLAEHDYSVIITVGDTHERILELVTQVKGGLADGVFLNLGYGMIREVDMILEQLSGISVPIIVNADIEPSKDYDVNWITDEAGAYEAIQYLCEKGHQRIAFIGHNIAELEQYGRYKGYVKALQDYNIELNPMYVQSDLDQREQAYQAIQDLLAMDDRPTAIFCTSDINALTAIATAQNQGLSVPDDLAVIGFGNISEGQFSYPRLTTVGPLQHTFDDIAELMVHRLTATKQMKPKKIIQRWQLIVRSSV